MTRAEGAAAVVAAAIAAKRRRHQRSPASASLITLLVLVVLLSLAATAARAAAFLPPTTTGRGRGGKECRRRRCRSRAAAPVVSRMADTQQQQRRRVVEFYSGIGGWAWALRRARPPVEWPVSAAYEVNPVANRVYEHNMKVIGGHTGAAGTVAPTARLIESTPPAVLESEEREADGGAAAVAWVLSPPCQPYTRNNKTDKRDTADPRAASLLWLCALLRTLKKPPSFIALENVEGFEHSDSCRRFLRSLHARGYEVLQCVLSPTMFGWPNERPRYYLLAARTQPEDAGRIHGLVREELASFLLQQHEQQQQQQRGQGRQQQGVGWLEVGGGKKIRTYLDADALKPEKWQHLAVPPSLLAKSAAWCFDIVTPQSTRSACFTKSYGKFVRGTGSVLHQRLDGGEEAAVALQSPEEREYTPASEWQPQFLEQGKGGLRYFSPTEVARLLHFPQGFAFPPDLPPKKAYELLGNSLHVGVAAALLDLLLPLPFQEEDHGTSSCSEPEGEGGIGLDISATAPPPPVGVNEEEGKSNGRVSPNHLFAGACTLAPLMVLEEEEEGGEEGKS